MRDSRVSATQNGEPAKNLVKTRNYISFTTTKTITVITGIASGTYIMSEVSAPEGYQKAADIRITVDDKGNVTSSGAMDGAVVVMIDDPFPVTPTPTPTGTVTPTPSPESTPTPTPGGGGKNKVTPTPGGGGSSKVTPTPTPKGGKGAVTPTPGGGGSNKVTPTPGGGNNNNPTPTPSKGRTTPPQGNGGNGRGLDRSPQTGDNNTAAIFAVAGLISMAALAVVTVIEKKKKKDQ